MKSEAQYYEPLVVDEVWIRQDGKLIKLELEEKEDDDEHNTKGQ